MPLHVENKIEGAYTSSSYYPPTAIMSSPLTDIELARLVQETDRLRELFGPIRMWPDDGFPMTPASDKFALVIAQIHGQKLYGYYTVIKTREAYVFMLMERRLAYGHWHLTPEFAFIPLTEVMGTGYWDDVTPEKIKTFV
jgi:hypothetical protein